MRVLGNADREHWVLLEDDAIAASPVHRAHAAAALLGADDHDGYYGTRQTEPAVTRFLRNHGLVVDGKVGPQTWEALFGLGEI